jgi:hypothetical protein
VLNRLVESHVESIHLEKSRTHFVVMAAPKTDFASWFSASQGSIGGNIANPAAAPAAPQQAAAGGFFGNLFNGGASPAPAAADIEAGQSETSSFLASATQSVGSLLGLVAPAAPPPDDLTCGLSTFQRFQLAMLLGGGAAVLFFLAIFLFLPSEARGGGAAACWLHTSLPPARSRGRVSVKVCHLHDVRVAPLHRRSCCAAGPARRAQHAPRAAARALHNGLRVLSLPHAVLFLSKNTDGNMQFLTIISDMSMSNTQLNGKTC